MSSSTEFQELPRPAPKARNQRFLRFGFLAGDEALFSNLSPAHSAVLLSRGSYEERAAALDIPIGTLRSRLHRARAALEALRRERDQPSDSDHAVVAH
jgi:DNA-directed RNA polymerase specialized sigma24 family protein